MANKSVSDVVFASAVAKVAAEGGRVSEVAALTGMEVGSVHGRLSNWRKKGYNVPNFKRGGGGGGRRIDADRINAIFAAALAPAESSETE
jgi:transposase